MFIDASAVISILTNEDDAEYLIAKIEGSAGKIYVSPIVAYEAIIGLARKKMTADAGQNAAIAENVIDRAQRIVRDFLQEIDAEEISISSDIGSSAIAAARAYGRVAGHRAQLNFGDCFSYACARKLGVPLLFKGNDFPRTDIEAA